MTIQQNKSDDELGKLVIHPAHGLGRISGQETLEMAGTQLDVSVISFTRSKLTLRIPTARLSQDGVRPLASETDITRMLEKLSSPSKVRQADQYRLVPLCEERINTGDLIKIANVARDLHRSKTVRDIPFSVETTYNTAVMRLREEMALVLGITEEQAHNRIMTQLANSIPLD